MDRLTLTSVLLLFLAVTINAQTSTTSVTIGADTDADGSGSVNIQIRALDRLVVNNDGTFVFPTNTLVSFSDPSHPLYVNGNYAAPIIVRNKIGHGPDRTIEWLGGTGGGQVWPHMLGAYFTPYGSFYSGVEMVLSNKRYNIDGGIQGVSATPDGSEPSILSISPDINGSSIAVEAHGAMGPGHENQTILAGYDQDTPNGGGVTQFSNGYGRKRFAIGARGQMFWGFDLIKDPAANADAKLSVEVGDRITIQKRLTVQSPEGETAIRINAVDGNIANLQFQRGGITGWSLQQLNYLGGSSPWLGLNGPGDVWVFRFNGTTKNLGIGREPDANKLSVEGDVLATGNVKLKTAGQGIILKSPDGSTCKLVAIDNAGALVLTTAVCP